MDLSAYKMRTTPTHVYFWGGPFSQWWKKNTFTAELPVFRPASDGRENRLVRSGIAYEFSSAEKYMMASKGSVFGDIHKGGTLEKIMGSAVVFGDTDKDARGYCDPCHDVQKCKEIGRSVPGLKGSKWDAGDKDFWDRASVVAVTIGSLAKFTQSDQLYGVMMDMGDRLFVEGSPRDDIWGVKLSWDDPKIEDEANWRGENRLGNVLNVARDIIRAYGRDIDPWKALAQFRRENAPANGTSASAPRM